MKKPAKAVVPARKPSPAAQPGNAPGRGKAAHAKPAPAKKVPPKVKAARHAAAVKAAKTRAANARKAKAHTRRGLAIGEGVACCSAQALAASLRLTGRAVSDDDVLALHWLAAGDVDTGVSILAALEAAAEFGLAGVRPRQVARWNLFLPQRAADDPGQILHGVVVPEERPFPGIGVLKRMDGVACPAIAPRLDGLLDLLPAGAHGLILGLDLPGPHAVCAERGRCWSWGELYDAAAFPDAVIEEVWEVTW